MDHPKINGACRNAKNVALEKLTASEHMFIVCTH